MSCQLVLILTGVHSFPKSEDPDADHRCWYPGNTEESASHTTIHVSSCNIYNLSTYTDLMQQSAHNLHSECNHHFISQLHSIAGADLKLILPLGPHGHLHSDYCRGAGPIHILPCKHEFVHSNLHTLHWMEVVIANQALESKRSQHTSHEVSLYFFIPWEIEPTLPEACTRECRQMKPICTRECRQTRNSFIWGFGWGFQEPLKPHIEAKQGKRDHNIRDHSRPQNIRNEILIISTSDIWKSWYRYFAIPVLTVSEKVQNTFPIHKIYSFIFYFWFVLNFSVIISKIVVQYHHDRAIIPWYFPTHVLFVSFNPPVNVDWGLLDDNYVAERG